MAFAIQMRPDVTLETAGEDSRDFWTKRARIAVANEMCGSIPVGAGSYAKSHAKGNGVG